MSWHNLDWIDVEVWEYDTALNDLVREPYLAAYLALAKTYQARKANYEEEVINAGSEADVEAANQQLMYSDYRWDEQSRALAAMALGLFASQNKLFLDSVKRLFDQLYPRKKKGYPGKSNLHKEIAEYKSRFGVDLCKLEGFETVREVGLARDCCLHNGGVPTREYRAQTGQRLIGHDDRIALAPDLLDVLILEISAFSRDLASKLKAVHENAKSKDKGD
jgi:hypothetical protein